MNATQPLQVRSAMNNLSRKEYRGAREALIGGIAIFWVVPIILITDPKGKLLAKLDEDITETTVRKTFTDQGLQFIDK